MKNNLYQINAELENFIASNVDEDGCIIEGSEAIIDSLFQEKTTKVLNICTYIKNEEAFCDMLKIEEEQLKKRRKTIENKIKWLKKYVLQNIAQGDKFRSEQVEISTRKSVSVDIIDQNLLPENCLKVVPASMTPDKIFIKELLKTVELKGAKLVEKLNLVIK